MFRTFTDTLTPSVYRGTWTWPLVKPVVALILSWGTHGSRDRELCPCSTDHSELSHPGWAGETSNGSPLQCSCLENPTDRGAWRATVHTHTHTDTQRHTDTDTHRHRHTHRHTNTYTHTQRHTDTHTQTHTHTASARAAPSVQEGLRREDRNHNEDLGYPPGHPTSVKVHGVHMCPHAHARTHMCIRRDTGEQDCSAASFLVSQESCYSTIHLVARGHTQGSGETGLVESQEGQLLSSAPTKGRGCGKVTSHL